MKKLEGKVAIVTGSSRGIGKEIAMKLAIEGAKVVINYSQANSRLFAIRGFSQLNSRSIDRSLSNGLIKSRTLPGLDFMVCFKLSLRPKNFSFHLVNCAHARIAKSRELFCQVDQIQQLVTSAVEQYGQLDILVSNAGIEHFGKLEEITPQDFERMFGVNVAGQLFVTQAAARYLPSGGRIVLTSSVSARMAVFYHTLYAASKAAVSAMVLNLAPELGRGSTINAIAPGGTATDMAEENAKFYTHPALRNVPPDTLIKTLASLQRLAKPEEIAAAVTFLVSDDASYISGSTLTVDGGRF